MRLFCQWRPKSFVLCNQNRAAEYACVDSIFHTASIGLGTSFMPARLRRSGIHCRCRVVELSGLQRPGELVNTEDPEGIARRTSATGVQAARQHPGGGAARRRSRMVRHSPPETAQMMAAPPSARRASPSARRRSRRRTAEQRAAGRAAGHRAEGKSTVCTFSWPDDGDRTYQDLFLEMVRKARRISALTPSAGPSLVVWGFRDR